MIIFERATFGHWSEKAPPPEVGKSVNSNQTRG